MATGTCSAATAHSGCFFVAKGERGGGGLAAGPDFFFLIKGYTVLLLLQGGSLPDEGGLLAGRSSPSKGEEGGKTDATR